MEQNLIPAQKIIKIQDYHGKISMKKVFEFIYIKYDNHIKIFIDYFVYH